MPGSPLLRSASLAGMTCIALLILGNSLVSGEMDRAYQAVRRVFPGTGTVNEQIIHLSKADLDSLRTTLRQQWPGDSITILIPDGKTGFAVLDNVKGKDQLITYLLSLTNELIVRDLEILAYREPYGGEVRNASWREQFLGKTSHDRPRIGRDIKNITGATISVRAVTEGVSRILTTLPLIADRISSRRPR